jgi:hypothetical protein
MSGTTEVVPCYKAHKFNTLRGAFSFRAGANLDAFALTLSIVGLQFGRAWDYDLSMRRCR